MIYIKLPPKGQLAYFYTIQHSFVVKCSAVTLFTWKTRVEYYMQRERLNMLKLTLTKIQVKPAARVSLLSEA